MRCWPVLCLYLKDDTPLEATEGSYFRKQPQIVIAHIIVGGVIFNIGLAILWWLKIVVFELLDYRFHPAAWRRYRGPAVVR